MTPPPSSTAKSLSKLHENIKTVETLTCVYHPAEDRLLLALNYKSPSERVDFWITRSFLLKLLPVFFQHSDGTTSTKEMQTKPKNSSASVTPTDSDMFALTRTEPILLESIDLSTSEGEISLTFKNLKQSVFYRCRFTQQTFDNFVSMVTRAAPTFEWGIAGW